MNEERDLVRSIVTWFLITLVVIAMIGLGVMLWPVK